jgi:hypothetical protein
VTVYCVGFSFLGWNEPEKSAGHNTRQPNSWAIGEVARATVGLLEPSHDVLHTSRAQDKYALPELRCDPNRPTWCCVRLSAPRSAPAPRRRDEHPTRRANELKRYQPPGPRQTWRCLRRICSREPRPSRRGLPSRSLHRIVRASPRLTIKTDPRRLPRRHPHANASHEALVQSSTRNTQHLILFNPSVESIT